MTCGQTAHSTVVKQFFFTASPWRADRRQYTHKHTHAHAHTHTHTHTQTHTQTQTHAHTYHTDGSYIIIMRSASRGSVGWRSASGTPALACASDSRAR